MNTNISRNDTNVNTSSYQNKVDLAGELAADPIIRTTTTGKQVVSFTLITRFKTFSEHHRIVIWPPLGLRAVNLRKGDFVQVVGRLQTSSWTDKQSGEKRYRTEIVGFQVSLPGESTEAPNGGTAAARAILKPVEMEASDDIHF